MNLVYIDEYGLLGSNFYWQNRERLGITDEELAQAGVTDQRLRIDRDLIEPLRQADRNFQKRGYRLYVKDGYRSPAVYQLAYDSRTQRFGKEQTDRVMNMEDMPHAAGRTVDITLWDPATNQEVATRDKNDPIDALFIGFYKNKTDPVSQRYQDLQNLMINTMLEAGFQLGKKLEYFHFTFA